MKIAYDHSIFTRQRYGGISRYITRLMQEMQGLGQEVRALTPIQGNAYLQALPDSMRSGWQTGATFYKVKGPFIHLNGWLGYGQARCYRPDVLHETYFAPTRTAPAAVPVVVTVHDMTHERFPHLFKAGDPSPRLKQRALARARRIICISRHTRRDLIDILHIPEERIEVIPHGFQPLSDPGGLPSGHPLDGRPYLLFVGGRGGYKNFQGLLHAFRLALPSLADYQLVAFGDRPFDAGERQLIHQLGLEGRIWHRHGDDTQLAWHYREARAFLFPSLYEGFGFPLLESMSLGCPVGASNNSALPETGGDAALYFQPDDPSDMARVITTLALDEELRTRQIHAGWQRMSSFSWGTCARRTLDVYTQCLSKT